MTEKDRLATIGQTYTMYDKDQIVNAFRAQTIVENAKGPNILELGCADGLVTKELCQNFHDVTAVDASLELLTKARQCAPRATFVHTLFEDFHPSEQYNTVILGHVLEHVENPLTILQMIPPWMNHGGIAIITVPNGDSIHRRVGVELGMLQQTTELNEDDIRIGHRRVFTIESLRDLVHKAGFTILREQGILLKPLSNRQMLHWPQELFQALYRLGKKLPCEYGGELCIVCDRTPLQT